MSNLIIDPSDVQQPLGFNPQGKVTQFEFRALAQQMQEALNEMGQTLHLISIRLEALLKMSAWCPDKLWTPMGVNEETGADTPPKLNLGEYYRYVDKMLQRYVPVCEGISNSPSFIERCQMAKRWNDGSPEMPICADELQLHKLVLRKGAGWPTDDETAAMNELPQTPLYKEHWNSVLAAKAKMGAGEAE